MGDLNPILVNGICSRGEHVIQANFKHDCLKNTHVLFLSFTQKSHLHTFKDSHFCLCPSGTLGVFFCFFFLAVRFCTKTIIPSILQMVLTAIIIISGTSLSCFCDSRSGGDLPGAPHVAFLVHLLVNITSLCQTCFYSTSFLAFLSLWGTVDGTSGC